MMQPCTQRGKEPAGAKVEGLAGLRLGYAKSTSTTADLIAEPGIWGAG